MCTPHAHSRIRTLAVAVVAAAASTMLFAGTAAATDTTTATTDTTSTTTDTTSTTTDTTSTTTVDQTLTLDGVAVEGVMPGCTVMTVGDQTYELVLPDTLTADQRDLALGIPLGVQMEVDAVSTDGLASYCMEGAIVEVQDITQY